MPSEKLGYVENFLYMLDHLNEANYTFCQSDKTMFHGNGRKAQLFDIGWGVHTLAAPLKGQNIVASLGFRLNIVQREENPH